MNAARNDNVRIEPLEADGIERMAALASEIWHDHYPGIITVAQIDYMLRQRYDPALVRAELGRSDIWWDQLFVDDELCGFSSFLLAAEPGTMKLDKLYVRTRCQRRGLGGLLIEHAVAVGRQQGCRRLILAVNKHNNSAIGAYLKHGFQVARSIVTDIGNGFVMDDYIMEKAVI